MAVNLVNSDDIEVTQTGDNIQLNTKVNIQTLESNIETNTNNIENLRNYVDEDIKSKYTRLWTGHTNSGTQVLNDSIENYDFILVVARGGTYTRGTTLIPVSLIEYGSGDTTPWSVVAFQTASVFGSLKLNFTNSTTISITEYHNNWTSGFLEEVIGIKL